MGSKGSTSPSVSTIQPANPSVPNEDSLNSAANWRIQASAPYLSSPWRSQDYYRNDQVPTSYVPQFNPATSTGMGAAVANSTPALQQQAAQQQGVLASGTSGAAANPAASFWTGQGPITQGTLPQTGGGASMQMPSAQAQAGMAQNVSPSLAGLGQLLMGILGTNGQQPPPQQAASSSTSTSSGTGSK